MYVPQDSRFKEYIRTRLEPKGPERTNLVLCVKHSTAERYRPGPCFRLLGLVPTVLLSLSRWSTEIHPV